jgi:hypothetical protein
MQLALTIILVVVWILLFVALPVWLCVRAKPIGDLPYRWGTFVAFYYAAMGLALLLAALSVTMKSPLGATVLGVVTVPYCLFTSAGLFRRRRYGVVLAFVPTALVILAFPFLYALPAEKWGEMLAGLIPTGLNLLYFKKRWALMTGGI